MYEDIIDVKHINSLSGDDNEKNIKETGEKLSNLYKSPVIWEAFLKLKESKQVSFKGSEFGWIEDFIDRIHLIYDSNYTLTDHDIIMTRRSTTDQQNLKFTHGGLAFDLIDVGGQSYLQNIWESHYNTTTAVVFLLSLSGILMFVSNFH